MSNDTERKIALTGKITLMEQIDQRYLLQPSTFKYQCKECGKKVDDCSGMPIGDFTPLGLARRGVCYYCLLESFPKTMEKVEG